MDPAAGLLWLLFVLAPIGTLLLPVLVVGALTPRFAAAARRLLQRGACVGLICAVLMAVLFMLRPELSMPGAGNLAMVLAAFMAGLAGAVATLALVRIIKP